MLRLIGMILLSLTITTLSEENINRSVALDKSFEYSNNFDNAELAFISKTPFHKNSIETIKNRIKPSIIVELFVSIEKSKIKGEDKKLTIYNTLKSYNSMQGIEYYSVSKDRLKTLFKKSYPTDKNWKKIDENRITSIPTKEEVYFFQEDLTLGENKNFGTFTSDENSIITHFYNTNDLSYMFLDVVDKKNLHSFFVVTEKETTFELYALSFVKPASLPLIKERISKSFGNRLVAMYNWFYANITK